MGFNTFSVKPSLALILRLRILTLRVQKSNFKQLLASEQVLKRKLEEILDNYDFILFDCPPSLGMLTINALTVAKEVFIPMAMEDLGYAQSSCKKLHHEQEVDTSLIKQLFKFSSLAAHTYHPEINLFRHSLNVPISTGKNGRNRARKTLSD